MAWQPKRSPTFNRVRCANFEAHGVETLLAMSRRIASRGPIPRTQELPPAQDGADSSGFAVQDSWQWQVVQRSCRPLLQGAGNSCSGRRALVLDWDAWRVRQNRRLTHFATGGEKPLSHRPRCRVGLRSPADVQRQGQLSCRRRGPETPAASRSPPAPVPAAPNAPRRAPGGSRADRRRRCVAWPRRRPAAGRCPSPAGRR